MIYKHYYVIPDIHGKYDLLKQALDRIYAGNPNGGKIIFLGDYIDRGTQNVAVLETVMNPPKNWEFICLLGNHEDMFLSAALEGTEYWDKAAAEEIFATGKITGILEWMENLRHYHFEDDNVFAHAWWQEEKYEPHLTYWLHTFDHSIQGPKNKHLVHGHTVYRGGPLEAKNRTNLDCGACFYGRLVVAKMKSGVKGPVEYLEFKESK